MFDLRGEGYLEQHGHPISRSPVQRHYLLHPAFWRRIHGAQAWGKVSFLPSSSAHIDIEKNQKDMSSEEQICFSISLARNDFEKALLSRILPIYTLEGELKTRLIK